MTMEEVEARLEAIEAELRTKEKVITDDELSAMQEEIDGLKARRKEIAEAAERRSALLASVASGTQGRVAVPTAKSIDEIRKSPEYVEAYANYIKTRNDAECRALLTENATNGTVPVPAIVEEIVKTAWEKDDITRLVGKSYFKGNVKQGFEISGSAAADHAEGGAAVAEGSIVTGVVELKPEDIMKWVTVSRETYNLGGEEFLRYIYSHLTYKIAKQAAKRLITKIDACTTVATTTQVNVGVVTATQASVGVVAEALAELSDEAVNPVVMINKKSWGALKQAQYANKFNVDPFEGLKVVFNNDIASFSAATTGDTWMIVGDLGNGAMMNLPAGDNIEFIVDKITSASAGMVKIFGTELVAIEPVAPMAFTKVVK